MIQKFKLWNLHVRGKHNVPELKFYADSTSDLKILISLFLRLGNDLLSAKETEICALYWNNKTVLWSKFFADIEIWIKAFFQPFSYFWLPKIDFQDVK